MIATPVNEQAAGAAAKKGRILVVDDEFGPRESLRFLFKNDYEITSADNVDDGIRMLREQAPDVVILDIKMPGKNGIDGLQEMRQVDPCVSIVMLTGFGSLRTAQLAMRYGANEYVRKPFDTHEMRTIVEQRIERSRLEKRRAAAAEELRDLNERMRGELVQKEKLADLGQYSSEMVHDLRNPLTVIYGYVHLLMEEMNETRTWEGKSAGDASNYLGIIERNVKRCERMLQTWRSRKDAGTEHTRTLTALPAVLDDLVADVQPLAAERIAMVALRPPPVDVHVLADSVELPRALLNLLRNAVQACRAGEGRVNIDASELDGATVHIRIRDNGCGIPEEYLHKLFNPYFTTRKDSGGMGLGLYITKSIIAAHGGTLTLVNNTDGPGATATVTLPIV